MEGMGDESGKLRITFYRVNEIMNLSGKKFRSKAPSPASLSLGRSVNLGRGLASIFCVLVIATRSHGERGRSEKSFGVVR